MVTPFDYCNLCHFNHGTFDADWSDHLKHPPKFLRVMIAG